VSSVDAAFLRDFADRWLTAWNSQDTDTVLALLHPDVRWDLVSLLEHEQTEPSALHKETRA
jgi:hypothetical protein